VVKIFNSLLCNVEIHGNDRGRLKNTLFRHTIINSFYSVTELLERNLEKGNKVETTFMADYLSSKCFYINYMYVYIL
jgi:hypothetical protein